MTFELVVKNARLIDVEGITSIGVSDGMVDTIEPELPDGERTIDAEEALVAGGFVDCHVHLDKALIAEDLPPNHSGTLQEAIDNIHERKSRYTVADVRDRADRAIELHVRNGCTRIRTHVDVDTIGGLTPLKGVLEARNAWKHTTDIEIVAFPQEGILQDPGTIELLDEAITKGADVVGGMPDNELTEVDTQTHVDVCLDIAEEREVPVDMHVDETDDPTARALEYLAARTIDRGFEGQVTAGHTCALAAYDESHANRVIQKLAEAEMTMVTNPPTNLLLQGRHDQHPKRRGITRVDQLLNEGLTVAAGQDCISDGFYPYGRASMLETALLTAHAAHLQTPNERTSVWDMVTASSAAVMNRGNSYALREGSRAIFNVFPPAVRTRTEAIRKGTPPRKIIHDGRIVAENEWISSIKRSAE